MTRVYVAPTFRGADEGEGGIRRVCEAMAKHLPAYGYEVTDTLEGADLVHTHAGVIPAVPASVPWVMSCHGLYWANYEWPQWAHKLNGQVIEAMRQADQVTACSEWVAQVIRRGMWAAPTILYHGVDPEDWTGGTNEGYVLWEKAYPHAVSDPGPVNELAKLLPDVPFVSTFGQEAKNVRLTGRVSYAEAAKLTRNAGVYLATTRETFGISILQAMAAGVPVVGWAWGGAREIVKQGVTGYLVRPGDYDGLVKATRWALEERERIGAAAQADVLERWTWPIAMQRYATLYDGLLERFEERRRSPKVSVIVPCHNLGKYLPDTIRSIAKQTMELSEIEVIIVDDASTDDTPEVIEALLNGPRSGIAQGVAFKNPVRVLRNNTNLHVAETRNRGFHEARGRYLVALDADDMLTPHALELMAAALDADRSIGIAYGGLQVMSEEGQVRPSPNEWPGAFSFRHQVEGRNQVPTMCMLRREVFDRTGGYRSRMSPCEDADLWTRAASIGFEPRKVTEAPTLLYRLRGASISRNMPQQEWAPWYPWARRPELTPFAAAVAPADGLSWPVPTFDPPRVAVVIPVGPGHERVLLDALDSVAAQVEHRWECIVVNDTGAPLPWVPSWAKVIDVPMFRDEGMSTLPSFIPVGPAKARNMAITESTAPLFVPLDADDYLQPMALRILLSVQKDTGGVVYSQWWDDTGTATAVYDPPDYDARLLTRKGCIHAVTALYPKAAWQQVGGFDTRLSHWEDWDFQLSLARAGICSTKIAAPLWTYRKATGQRREQNLAAFEEGKAAILAKWSSVWDGKEELMACRTCGGTTVHPRVGVPDNPASTEGLVKLEYLGPSAGSVTYRGISGASYRFANSDGNRVKYVKQEDVTGLLALTGKFRRAEVQMATPAADAPELTTRPVAVMAPPAPPPPSAPVPPAPPRPSVGPSQEPAPAMGDASYRALRERLPSMTEEQIAVDLAAERARPEPRANVVKLLEAALRKGSEPADA